MSNMYAEVLKELERVSKNKPEGKITKNIRELLLAGMISEGALCSVSYEKEQLLLTFRVGDEDIRIPAKKVETILKNVSEDDVIEKDTESLSSNDILVDESEIKSENRIQDAAMPICETIEAKEDSSSDTLILMWDGKASDVRVTMADERLFLPADAKNNNKIIIPAKNIIQGSKIHVSLYGNVKNFHYKWQLESEM